MLKNISVTILTKNSQRRLDACLTALAEFGEIIVLDTGSSDETAEITRSHPKVRFYTHPFIGFGALKNLAISYTKNDWVFSVDSDEIVTPALRRAIASLKLETSSVYQIRRHNFYNNRHINGCGWENDYVIRLFNKHTAAFSHHKVHERVIASGQSKTKTISGVLEHYPFDNASELLRKLEHYSTLWSEQQKDKKRATVLTALTRSLLTFLKCYLLKKGFLYGYEGLLISVSNASGVFYKYIKLYEIQKNNH